MRRVTSLAILAFLVAALSSAAVLGSEPADAGPSAVVAEPKIDAGTVPVGEAIEAEFVIENQGDAPLKILRVQPDCGCTVADYPETIEPGAAGSVRAVVDTVSLVGPNQKTISVLTNDPEKERIQLRIDSNVKPFLALEPGRARFPMFVHDDRDQTIPQLLWTDDFEELEITDVEAPSPWVKVSYREATGFERSDQGTGKQWRIDVTLSEEAPVGPVSERVLVRTNHPRQRVVEVPVSGFVRPRVVVTPQEVNFGRIDPAEEQKWGVHVRSFGSKPLRIQLGESTVQGIEVDIQPLQEGQQYYVIFTPTEEIPKGPFEGRIELETNLPQEPRITVSLQGEVL